MAIPRVSLGKFCIVALLQVYFMGITEEYYSVSKTLINCNFP
jgi:hypothetical protein